MPAPNAAALIRANAADPERARRPAIKFADQVWTHAEFYAEARRFAGLFRDRLPAGEPAHVGVLLDNTPDYLFVVRWRRPGRRHHRRPQPHPT